MIQDNRIRFTSSLIDFINDVGTTGQNHDNYPSPGQQARFDHLRMFLIGLLSSQSSENEPNEYREGTWWFDLTNNTIKIRSNNNWVQASKVIQLGLDINDQPITLQDWYDAIAINIQSVQSDIFFYTKIVSNNLTLLPIPSLLQSKVIPGSKAFVHINGVLVNPIITELEPSNNPTAIRIPSVSNGDTVVAVIKYFPANKFLIQVQQA